MTETVVSTEGSQERELLGHPIGLAICFLTEMWERFSYYGMRAILIFYLTEHFLFSAGDATLIFGTYIGLAYLLPILGGLFADRYLGSRKAVTYGALLLVAGHLSLAFEGPTATIVNGAVERSEDHVSIFYFSLALIITGVGFLKANISTIVGALYGPNDPRRDGGFTIFYMGINLGSVLATWAVVAVARAYGWNWGFGLAGVGMLFGLLVFLWGQKYLDGRAEPKNPAILKERSPIGLNKEHSIYLLGLGLVGLMWVMMQYQELVGKLLGITGLAMIAIIIGYGFLKCEPHERNRLMVASFLIMVQSIFWALFEQQGGSLSLLAKQQFDLVVFGFTILPGQVQTLNPLFVFILAPIFAWMWVKLANKGLEPSTPAKFGIAMILIGFGYVFFSFGIGLDDSTEKSFFWMLVIYFFLTTAELCLSPVGLSMVTKLSVTRIVGMVMGTWFLFTSLGNYASGVIGKIAGGTSHSVEDSALLDVAATIDVFNTVGIMSMGVGVVLLVLTPLMKKYMHGVH